MNESIRNKNISVVSSRKVGTNRVGLKTVGHAGGLAKVQASPHADTSIPGSLGSFFQSEDRLLKMMEEITWQRC
jgi:hypothetical protein